MKILLAIASFLLSTTISAQPSGQQNLQSVNSVDEARQFIHDHPQSGASLQTFMSGSDTSTIERRLYERKKGDIITLDGISYKVLEDTTTFAFRASYIYLDGTMLSQNAIDSLRKLIFKRYSAGTTFERLADEFNMDGNQKHGDMGVFASGMMVKEFEKAVREHENGDVFPVDVPKNQWYYVVKKTAPTEVTRRITVFQFKGK